MNNLSAISAQLEEAKALPIKDKINLALKIGCSATNTDLGIVSLITEAKDYKVEYVYPTNIGLEAGANFELGNTYCDITYGQKSLLAIDHMAKSEFKLHPCYSAFKIESYIGDVYRIGQQVMGTVNFSSVPPRDQAFDEQQKETVRFLARYIGQVMEEARKA